MPDAAWKKTERKIAAKLGGKRQLRTGGPHSDVKAPEVAAECKHTRKLPEWIKHALAQARDSARPGEMPIAVLHQDGQDHDRDAVIMRLDDFVEWFGSRPLEHAPEVGA